MAERICGRRLSDIFLERCPLIRRERIRTAMRELPEGCAPWTGRINRDAVTRPSMCAVLRTSHKTAVKIRSGQIFPAL